MSVLNVTVSLILVSLLLLTVLGRILAAPNWSSLRLVNVALACHRVLVFKYAVCDIPL